MWHQLPGWRYVHVSPDGIIKCWSHRTSGWVDAVVSPKNPLKMRVTEGTRSQDYTREEAVWLAFRGPLPRYGVVLSKPEKPLNPTNIRAVTGAEAGVVSKRKKPQQPQPKAAPKAPEPEKVVEPVVLPTPPIKVSPIAKMLIAEHEKPKPKQEPYRGQRCVVCNSPVERGFRHCGSWSCIRVVNRGGHKTFTPNRDSLDSLF